MQSRDISIWFFIGVLFGIYGLLIGAYGISELVRHHTAPVVLANLHAPIWWGGAMFVLGVFYCVKFAPRKNR